MFDEALNSPLIKTKQRRHGEELEKKVKNAIKFLRNNQEPISFRAITRLLGIARETLIMRPTIKTMIEQARAENRKETEISRESHIEIRVTSLIEEFKMQGKPITQVNISQGLGVSVHLFDHRKKLAKMVEEERQNQNLLSVYESRVAIILKELESQAIPISQTRVAQALGVNKILFQRQKVLAKMIEEARQNQKLLSVYESRVAIILKELESQAIPISQTRVAQALGVSIYLFQRERKLAYMIEEAKDHQRILRP